MVFVSLANSLTRLENLLDDLIKW